MTSLPAARVVRLLAALLAAAVATPRAASDPPPAHWFLEAMTVDDREADEALDRLAERWHDGYAAIVIDLARFTRPDEASRTVDVSGVQPPVDPQGLTFAPGRTGAQFRNIGGRRDPTAPIRARLLRFLERQTGQRFGDDLDRWRRWTWSLPYEPHPEYRAIKAELSRGVDPRMTPFFSSLAVEAARLDEIEWSGMGVDDAPPLVTPAHTEAAAARYLRDRHLVIGLSIDGEARAYPLRILAWHYAVHDRVGGRDLLIVHCPLSGTAAAYDLGEAGAPDRFGTSGLVYRSGTLLFDVETGSLWSMLTGAPVLGRLAGPGVELSPVPSVLATWRDWRADHPQTRVLSPETGSGFTYAEGALSRRRLAEIGLVFPAPDVSADLRPEDEVLGIRPGVARDEPPAAIATRGLGRRQVREVQAGGRRVVVTTGRDGAARVYAAPDAPLVRQRGNRCVEDAAGRCWHADEDALVLAADPSLRTPRVPAARAFWLAWAAEYPDTVVVR